MTSYCCSKWHAMLSGIQFIWGMLNHKPYLLQPGRLTQQGPGEREKEADWGLALRGRHNTESTTCLLSRFPPVVPLKCGQRWYFVLTWMSTNSKCMCWMLVFWPLSRESLKECCQKSGQRNTEWYKRQMVSWLDRDNEFSRSCCLSCGQVFKCCAGVCMSLRFKCQCVLILKTLMILCEWAVDKQFLTLEKNSNLLNLLPSVQISPMPFRISAFWTSYFSFVWRSDFQINMIWWGLRGMFCLWVRICLSTWVNQNSSKFLHIRMTFKIVYLSINIWNTVLCVHSSGINPHGLLLMVFTNEASVQNFPASPSGKRHCAAMFHTDTSWKQSTNRHHASLWRDLKVNDLW